jgi:cyclophilin family peptidyl-prolyl cis-trans isomerase
MHTKRKITSVNNFFVIAVAIISLTACTTTKPTIVDENTTSSHTTSNNKPIEKTQKINKNTNNKQSTMTNPRTTINDNLELKDLSAEFSQAKIKTNLGDITLKLYGEDSPLTVNNFLNLAESGFYNGTKFHRIISDFMIQGGDPNSKDDAKKAIWGTGGPDYRFKDEFNAHPLVRGSFAMANSGPATNGSQFFIVTKDATSWLDGKHTNFGEVVEGMEVVEAIEAVKTDPTDKPLENITIESIELLK